MSQELNVLFPQGKTITIKGEEITITPFKLGEMQRVFKAVEPIYTSMISLASTTTDKGHLFTMLMSSQGHHLVEVASIGLRKPVSWMEDLDLDEAANAVMTVVEVNLDFFVQKVLPNLNQRVEAMIALKAGSTQ